VSTGYSEECKVLKVEFFEVCFHGLWGLVDILSRV
jgi:hypothetical protein